MPRQLRDRIYARLPKPAALCPRSGLAKRLLVLTRYPNPTFSYYFEERMTALAGRAVIVRRLEDALDDLDPDGLFVVVCRYIKGGQLSWLETNRYRLAGVALFVDDDIASVLTQDETVGWPYRIYLAYLGVWPLRRLNPLLSHVWASTDVLAQSLAKPGQTVDVVRPMPAVDRVEAAERPHPDHVKMVYHATDVHRREHDFLMPIVEEAMGRHPNLHFEVFANARVARRWQARAIDVRRLSVRSVLSWPAYVAATAQEGADIALVALLDGRTNACRADTKRIDVSRMGAAAVFSRNAVFARCAMEGEIHVDNTPEDWSHAIDILVVDRQRRLQAANATIRSMAVMRETAEAFPIEWHREGAERL